MDSIITLVQQSSTKAHMHIGVKKTGFKFYFQILKGSNRTEYQTLGCDRDRPTELTKCIRHQIRPN